MTSRARDESGFALIEMLIAIVVINIGLLAILLALTSGVTTLRRSAETSTASAVADRQLERYRAQAFASIYLDTTALAATDSTYQSDAAYSASQVNQACGTLTAVCTPTQTVTGPDGRSYRVDTYIVWTTPAGGTAVKQVTVVVRKIRHDGNARARRLDRRRRLLAPSQESAEACRYANGMAAFAYSAINALGAESAGQITAPDVSSARELLRQKGLRPVSLSEVGAVGASERRSKRVKLRYLQVFSRQFATMIDAGLNVVASLVILEQQTDDKALAAVIREVRSDVEGGMLLSQAMARHPNAFDRLYISMIEAGEAAGILDTVLDRVAVQIEKEMKIRRRVRGAMIYPLVVLTFAILTLIGMLLFLVPVFEGIFADLGGDLPTLTKGVVAASDLVRGYWFILFPAMGALRLGLPALEEDTGRTPGLGSLQAAHACGHRQGRPEGDDRALHAHPRHARRRGRRHHQGARDLGPDLRQLGRRVLAGRGAREGAPGRPHRPAADRGSRLPAARLADGQDRRGDR